MCHVMCIASIHIHTLIIQTHTYTEMIIEAVAKLDQDILNLHESTYGVIDVFFDSTRERPSTEDIKKKLQHEGVNSAPFRVIGMDPIEFIKTQLTRGMWEWDNQVEVLRLKCLFMDTKPIDTINELTNRTQNMNLQEEEKDQQPVNNDVQVNHVMMAASSYDPSREVSEAIASRFRVTPYHNPESHRNMDSEVMLKQWKTTGKITYHEMIRDDDGAAKMIEHTVDEIPKPMEYCCRCECNKKTCKTCRVWHGHG
jgi:hypothetical protein